MVTSWYAHPIEPIKIVVPLRRRECGIENKQELIAIRLIPNARR
jgi:hypothetical protein